MSMINSLELKARLNKTEVELADLYSAARAFFDVGWQLKLFGHKWNKIFSSAYYADRLIQSVCFTHDFIGKML